MVDERSQCLRPSKKERERGRGKRGVHRWRSVREDGGMELAGTWVYHALQSGYEAVVTSGNTHIQRPDVVLVGGSRGGCAVGVGSWVLGL